MASAPAPHPDTGAEIAIITVNYGTADLTIKAAQSVLAYDHAGRTIEHHIVDNAAPGDDAARLQDALGGPEYAGRITLHLETENHGFGRGNNVALRLLAGRAKQPRYVMLLNPDAALDNEAVAMLAACLDEKPHVAAVGAAVTLPDGTPTTAAFRFPGALSELERGISMWPVRSWLDKWRIALPPEHPEGPVDWVIGAAVMMRMDVLKDVGFFDPDFFLYYEEVDLMRRIRAAGHSVWYLPVARVTHDEGAATQVSWKEAQRKRKPGYLYDSWRIYFRKAYGRGGAFAISALLMVGSAVNLIVKTLTGRTSATPVGFFKDQTTRVMLPLLTGRDPKG